MKIEGFSSGKRLPIVCLHQTNKSQTPRNLEARILNDRLMQIKTLGDLKRAPYQDLRAPYIVESQKRVFCASSPNPGRVKLSFLSLVDSPISLGNCLNCWCRSCYFLFSGRCWVKVSFRVLSPINSVIKCHLSKLHMYALIFVVGYGLKYFQIIYQPEKIIFRRSWLERRFMRLSNLQCLAEGKIG